MRPPFPCLASSLIPKRPRFEPRRRVGCGGGGRNMCAGPLPWLWRSFLFPVVRRGHAGLRSAPRPGEGCFFLLVGASTEFISFRAAYHVIIYSYTILPVAHYVFISPFPSPSPSPVSLHPLPSFRLPLHPSPPPTHSRTVKRIA